jgi:hypothetical protein
MALSWLFPLQDFRLVARRGADSDGAYLLGLSGTAQSGTRPAVATYANGQFHISRSDSDALDLPMVADFQLFT